MIACLFPLALQIEPTITELASSLSSWINIHSNSISFSSEFLTTSKKEMKFGLVWKIFLIYCLFVSGMFTSIKRSVFRLYNIPYKNRFSLEYPKKTKVKLLNFHRNKRTFLSLIVFQLFYSSL